MKEREDPDPGALQQRHRRQQHRRQRHRRRRDASRVYSEGPEDSPSRSLAQFAKRIGERYVPSHEIRLMARRDRFSRGGDHSGFNAEGFAAIGFRESRENYSKQHNANDTIDGVSFPYLAQNARVNAAGMAVLALAPPPPEVSARTC